MMRMHLSIDFNAEIEFQLFEMQLIQIVFFCLGLRRRRQAAEKYVTDPSQLNLRFYRTKTRGIMR